MTGGMLAATIDVGQFALEWLAGRLAAGSVQGAVLIGLVWLLCWRIRSIPPSARALLWWGASLKLVLSLLALPTIPVPLLPPAAPIETVGVFETMPLLPTQPVQVERSIPAAAPQTGTPFWLLAAMALWLAGLTVHVRRLLAGSRHLRGVLARAVPLDDDGAAEVARLASEIGLRETPDVRASSEVDTPQVAGVLRPVVLLPSRLALTSGERAMALCHELMHVRRHDVLLGWVPACAERLFFFHPLARLAASEYLLAREAACDAAVVRTLGVAPREYGQVLLRLGIAATEPGLSAAGSSRSLSSLKRRLDMLHHTTRPRRIVWLIAGLAALSLLPLQLVARSPQVLSSQPEAVAQEPPSAAAARLEAAAIEPVAARAVKEPRIARAGNPERSQGASQLEPAEQAAQAERDADEGRRAIEVQKLMEARLRETQKFVEARLRETQAAAEQQLLDESLKQRSIEELSNMLREIERAVRQDALTDLRQAEAAKAAKEALKLQKLAEQQRLETLKAFAEQLERKAAASIDQNASLTDQLDQLRGMQESMAIQMQMLTKQQEALRESQKKLAAEADRIREAIENAKIEAGKAAPAK
ncbi:MAG TPA: M56 family metallopeptidase [Vicinamibacterales bacterium]|nr:M56 family metallopeptidase [Vicinamibacterales bacterium]